MRISNLILNHVPEFEGSQLVGASLLPFNLSQPSRMFYRHGWQSWTLTTWLDPGHPLLPVHAAEFRMKDEDPGSCLALWSRAGA
jgi:hypothetical protein